MAAEMAEQHIADIASRWAFASQSHVTREFRARFGCTPSEVRHAPPPSETGASAAFTE